jgi:hypothetical protein
MGLAHVDPLPFKTPYLSHLGETLVHTEVKCLNENKYTCVSWEEHGGLTVCYTTSIAVPKDPLFNWP